MVITKTGPEAVKKKAPAVPLKNYMNGEVLYDTLYAKADRPMGCTPTKCHGSMITQWKVKTTQTKYFSIENLNLAESFLREYFVDMKREREFPERWEQVLGQLTMTGSYILTPDELEYAAKLAWRNHTRCVARIQWKNLFLFDHREDVNNTDQMFKAICEFIKYANNNGVIRPAICVFRPRMSGKHDLRIWNTFTLAFAGYEVEEEVKDQESGKMVKKIKKIGDQGNLEFTQFCQRLGWKGKGTDWDILPMVLSDDGQPKFYEIPEEIVIRVKITHPTLKAIDDLNLQWYSLPSVAGMMLEAGGLQFPSAPFGGWYASIEVVRDFLEPRRYNLLNKIATVLGLDQSNNANLWKDRVSMEVNVALLHSFNKAGVSIVDHHSVSDQFQIHMADEYRTRGGCPSDWLWMTPAQSGSLTPLFHQEMLHYHLTPSYEANEILWRNYRFPEDGEKRIFKFKQVVIGIMWAYSLFRKKALKMPQLKIFYSTETGTSKRYAEKLQQKFGKTFNAQLLPAPESDFSEVLSGFCIFVTSTFGNGDPPKMAEKFSAWIEEQLNIQDLMTSDVIEASDFTGNINRRSSMLIEKKTTKISDLKNLSYGVFALGSSSYPKFCGFGKRIDFALQRLNGNRLVKIGLGDELGDRDQVFQDWSSQAFRNAGLEAGLKEQQTAPVRQKITRWKVEGFATPKRGIQQTMIGQEHINGQKMLKATIKKKTELPSVLTQALLLGLEIEHEPSDKPLYVPGDHLGVFPVNDDADVDFVISKLSGMPEDCLNTIVQLQEYIDGQGWVSDSNKIPAGTIRDLFKYYLNIRATPTASCMEYFSRRVTDPNEKETLEKIASDFDTYNQWRHGWPNIVDVFRQFPSLKADSAEFIGRLPIIQPRFYSIASSLDYLTNGKPKSSPSPCDLIMDVAKFEGQDGQTKTGFCSGFLYNLPVGTSFVCFMRTAEEFHLPMEPFDDIPLILIGAGTGLAPFRGFWQHKAFQKAQKRETGDIKLFFGCHNDSTNWLKDETEAIGEDFQRITAFSRMEGLPKRHVQDLISEQSKELFFDFILRRGSIYICGNVTMANEVYNVIVKIVMEHTGLDANRASALINRIRNEGRFSQDIFGQ